MMEDSYSQVVQEDIMAIDETKSIVLKGHSGFVCCVCISRDGRRIASGGVYDDPTVRLWEGDSSDKWKEIKKMNGHTNGIWCVSFAGENDEFILSCSDDKTIICWKVENGEKVHVFAGHSHCVYDLLLLPNRTSFATASNDETIRIWSITTGQQIGMVDTGADCYSLALSNDNRHIASGHYDSANIMIWDASSLCFSSSPSVSNNSNNNSNSNNNNYNNDRNNNNFNACMNSSKTITTNHTQPIWRLCYNRNDKLLASGSWDNTITIYNTENDAYSLLKTLNGHNEYVTCVIFIGNILISCSEDKTMKFWDIGKGECIKTIKHQATVNSVAVSSRSDMIVSGSDDKTVKIMRVKPFVDVEALFGDIKNAARTS